MIQIFKNAGYEIVNFDDKADIYIINTCTVTNMSDRKSRQVLRQAKKNNPNSIVVAIRLLCTSFKRRIRKICRTIARAFLYRWSYKLPIY